MPSLSERTMDWGRLSIEGKESLLCDMAEAIEFLTEARVAASNYIETLQLRIEELEAQVAALVPPKHLGPFVKPAWKPLSESDVPAKGGA